MRASSHGHSVTGSLVHIRQKEKIALEIVCLSIQILIVDYIMSIAVFFYTLCIIYIHRSKVENRS